MFVTFNDARWPHDSDLDGYWEMGDDDQVSPMVEAAHVAAQQAVGPLRVRIDLREDDWFDWTDDDFELEDDHFFTAAGRRSRVQGTGACSTPSNTSSTFR